MPAPATIEPEERVLSTLNRDGSRRWLCPRVSAGRFLTWRRVVAYGLIVVYNVLPWIKIGGRPSVLLDIPRREFTFFGTTFLPTDTLLLMLFLAAVFVAIFLLTALFGRLWCGWACPQTVYMEFVYRPIERLFDGKPDARGRPPARRSPVRRFLKYAVFFLVSLHLAHTFLAYFVGPENLLLWTTRSPLEHPTAFLVVASVTGLMMFDFCLFREQTCIVACPYGRFQSVMLDRQSLIITYDEERGEPRGRARRRDDGDLELPRIGDCVDCHLCVTTCPTGIDIRNGLQMECIGCAQCIDACDAVMDKLGRPRGLVRYSSQATMEHAPRRLLRLRVVLYPLLLAVILAAFGAALIARDPVDLTLLRGANTAYVRTADGLIANAVRVKIVNRDRVAHGYTLEVDGLAGARLETEQPFPVRLGPGEGTTIAGRIVVPDDAFTVGRARVTVRIRDDASYSNELTYRLQGPWGAAGAGGDG